jgi:hypothetical protein
MTWYIEYRRLGGPQDLSERVRKTSPSLGFDPQTIEPIVSRYTECAIPAHPTHIKKEIIAMQIPVCV